MRKTLTFWTVLLSIGCGKHNEALELADAGADVAVVSADATAPVPDLAPDAPAPADTTAPAPDVAADASPDAAPSAAFVSCKLPAGTTATTSGNYLSSTGEKAIDGTTATQWNSGDHQGWIQLAFAQPQRFGLVLVAADALPVTEETYAISGHQKGVATTVGGGMRTVPLAPGAALAPFPVWPVDAYDGLRIFVNGGASWVSVGEIGLVAPLPSGTTATASGGYLSRAADAIDGNALTGWNSGEHTGWLQVKFPSPQRMNGLFLHAAATPATEETYRIIGHSGGQSASIGSARRLVSTGAGGVLPFIPVTPGSYDELRIEAGDSQSWIVIHDLWIVSKDEACIAP